MSRTSWGFGPYAADADGGVIADMAGSILAVERLLNYRFKERKLIEDALTHPSCAESESYQRLEFVGDAALGLAVTNYMYSTYPGLNPGQLTSLRIVNINTEKLARVAVKHKLYRYVRHNALELDHKVTEFASAVEKEDETVVYGGVMKAPKVLADIVESVAAAVYVDCQFDLQALWVVFRGLLEPIVMLDMLNQQPQPITTLFEVCQKDGKQLNIKHQRNGEKSVASVYVEGQFVASGSSGQKINAKLHAAEAALQKLSQDVINEDMSIDVYNGVNGTYEVASVCVDGQLVTSGSSGQKINAKLHAAEAALQKLSQDVTNEDVSIDVYNGVSGTYEIEGAKSKLHELCGKKRWPKPIYKVDKELGPAHDRKYVCSVQTKTVDGVLFVSGNQKTRVRDAESSAASLMIYGMKEAGYI